MNQRLLSAPYHIVIVDDDVPVLETLTDKFEHEGFVVFAASSFPEALAVFKGQPRVDLLVTDYNIAPGATGIHLALEVRKTRPDLPVLIVTGNPHAVMDDTPLGQSCVVGKGTPLSSVIKAAYHLLNGDESA